MKIIKLLITSPEGITLEWNLPSNTLNKNKLDRFVVADAGRMTS